jgi:hypothetical protein
MSLEPVEVMSLVEDDGDARLLRDEDDADADDDADAGEMALVVVAFILNKGDVNADVLDTSMLDILIGRY